MLSGQYPCERGAVTNEDKCKNPIASG